MRGPTPFSTFDLSWDQSIILTCDKSTGQATVTGGSGSGRRKQGAFGVAPSITINATKVENGKSSITVSISLNATAAEGLKYTSMWAAGGEAGWKAGDAGGVEGKGSLSWTGGWESTIAGGYEWGIVETATYNCCKGD